MRSLGLSLLFLLAAPLLAGSDIDGKWTMHVLDAGDNPVRKLALNIKVADDGAVSGTLASSELKGTFKDGELKLEFEYVDEESAGKGILKITGKSAGGVLAGEWSFNGSVGNFKTVRVP